MNPHTLATQIFGTQVLGTSTVELTIRMVVALAVTLLTITTGTRVIRHYRNNTNTTTNPITIHHQQQLTKHTQLTLLTTGTRQLLIATNPTTTTLLAQGPDLTPPTTNTPQTTQTKTTKPKTTKPAIDIRTPRNPIRQLQNKTVRRA
jgi:flagellar biogenesis protein FliO